MPRCDASGIVIAARVAGLMSVRPLLEGWKTSHQAKSAASTFHRNLRWVLKATSFFRHAQVLQTIPSLFRAPCIRTLVVPDRPSFLLLAFGFLLLNFGIRHV